MQEEEIVARIQECVSRVVDVPVQTVATLCRSDSFGKLGMDSIKGVMFVLELETMLAIKFEMDELKAENFRTVSATLETVKSKMLL